MPTLLKVILTPVAVALDFALKTSEYHVNVLRWLGGYEQIRHGPIAPTKDR